MTLFYAAAHALIERDGKYLATRRSTINDYMPLKWDLPGGTADPGETLEEALVREVYEETQLQVTIDRILHVYANRATLPERQTFQSVFLCRYANGDVALDPTEHDRFAWLPKVKLAELESDAMAFLANFIHTDTFRQIESCTYEPSK